jgi:hypothetical protein
MLKALSLPVFPWLLFPSPSDTFYMKYNNHEAAELPNISYPSPVHLPAGRSVRNIQKDRLSRRKLETPGEDSFTKPRSLPKAKSPRTPLRLRFQSAFSKAIAVRVRVLKRALTTLEWRRLRDAVRLQCTPRKTDSLSTRVEALTQRLTQLENASPQGALMLQDSISMFATQVSVLREQFLQHTIDKEHVQEGCPHFQHKKLFTPPNPELLVSSLNLPGLGIVSWQPKDSTLQLCCLRCLEARQDALFYWTGFYLKSFNDMSFYQERTLARMSSKERSRVLPDSVSPLMIQEIWSQIISLKFKVSV